MTSEVSSGHHCVVAPDGQRILAHRTVQEGREAVEAYDHPVVVGNASHVAGRGHGRRRKAPRQRYPGGPRHLRGVPHDRLAVGRRYGLVEASGLGRVTSAAPFLRTVVGTDTYADQLW